MKNLFLLAFILITKTTFAQKDTVGLNTPLTNGTVVYERIFNAPGKSKAMLFDNAQLWFIKHYDNLNSIQIQNKYTGRVVGKGAELIKFKAVLGLEVESNARFTVQIDCKNNKYRCRVFNVILETEGAEKSRIFTTANDLMNYLADNKDAIVNPVAFNKNQSKKILQSLNAAINNVLLSLNQIMVDQDDF